MPTATKFTALGKGNGFPFCPQRVDVDGLYFQTLGGVTQFNVGGLGAIEKEAKIEDSRLAAMKLFWMFYSLTTEQSEDGAISEITVDCDNNLSRGVSLPPDRKCPSVHSASLGGSPETFEDHSGVYGVHLALEDAYPNYNNAYARLMFNLDGSRDFINNNESGLTHVTPIVRMYSGGDFIGYGKHTVQPNDLPFLQGEENTGFATFADLSPQGLVIGSYYPTPPPSTPPTPPATTGGHYYGVAHVTISGVPLVCYMESFGYTGDASDMRIDYDGTDYIKIKSIGFYDPAM